MKKILSLLVLTLSFVFIASTEAISTDSYDISVENNSLGRVPLNAVRLPLTQITITAKKDITVSEIHLRRSGLSSWDDFGNIWAETNSYRRSLRGRINSNDDARIRFRTPLSISAGMSEVFTVYINLDLDSSGNTFSFSLEDVVINEKKTTQLSRFSSFQSRSRTRGSLSTLSETSSFSVPSLELSVLGNNGKIAIGALNEVGSFRLRNTGNKDALLKSITFKNYGKSDLETDFSQWQITNNEKLVTSDIRVSRDNITFELNDYVLGQGDGIILKVKAQLVNAKRGNTVQLGIQFDSDIIAELKNTGVNAGINLKSKRLKKHSLGSGNLAIIQSYNSNRRNNRRPTYRTRNNFSYTNSRRTYSPGSKDVLFLQKSFNEKYAFRSEGIFIPLSSFNASDKNSNGIANESADLEETYNNFRLFIDGDLVDSTNDISEMNGQKGLLFNSSFEAQKRSEVRVLGRISNKAINGDAISFNLYQADILDQEYYWQ